MLYLGEAQQELYKIIISNKELRKIISKLFLNGWKVYLVGGCIRDIFMEIKSKDIDLVTNATPEIIMDLFLDRKVNCRGKFLVTVVDGFEIATYRKDVHNTGLASECEVERVETLEEDLSRRDFTCNAIAYDPITGDILDFFYGYADICDRMVRFVGDPDKRIKEGFERIIRACRFYAKLEGGFENKTLDALRRNCHLIKELPREKIQLEIEKAMKLQKTSLFFRALHLIGALKYIFPSLEDCFSQDGGPHHAETVFNHCMEVGDAFSTKNWKLKLTGYLHDVGKFSCAEISAETMKLRFRNHPEEGAKLIIKELSDLKFGNDTIEYISNLILLHMTSLKDNFSKKAVKRFLVKLEQKKIDYRDWMKLLIADRKGNYKSKNFFFGEIRNRLKRIHDLFREEKMFSLKDLVVDGRDVMEVTKLGSGPEVGRILNLLFDDCFENPEHNTRAYLLNVIYKFSKPYPHVEYDWGKKHDWSKLKES